MRADSANSHSIECGPVDCSMDRNVLYDDGVNLSTRLNDAKMMGRGVLSDVDDADEDDEDDDDDDDEDDDNSVLVLEALSANSCSVSSSNVRLSDRRVGISSVCTLGMRSM